jgi:hypothetical protein
VGIHQSDHPRDRIAQFVATAGERRFVDGCVAMLHGADGPTDLVLALGGRHADRVIDHTPGAYWGRVWGARGLLYVWDDSAVPALVRATHDPHWRVREMVAKVAAKWHVDDAAATVAPLRADTVPRVRAAAERALMRLAAPGPAMPRASTSPTRQVPVRKPLRST